MVFLGRLGLDPDGFALKGRENPAWVEHAILEHLRMLRGRVEAGKISCNTVRNYYKPIKLFLEMNDASLNWKRLQWLLPRERAHAMDRAPTVEEARAVMNERQQFLDKLNVLEES